MGLYDFCPFVLHQLEGHAGYRAWPIGVSGRHTIFIAWASLFKTQWTYDYKKKIGCFLSLHFAAYHLVLDVPILLGQWDLTTVDMTWLCHQTV